MNPNNNGPRTKPDVKPVEIDRWEGEGGNPPTSSSSRRNDPSPTITAILRKLLVDWHLINSPAKN